MPATLPAWTNTHAPIGLSAVAVWHNPPPKLRAAQDELYLAVKEEDDSETCADLRRVIATLQDVILRIQLSA